MDNNGWDEHRIHVSRSLERLEEKVDNLVTDVSTMKGAQAAQVRTGNAITAIVAAVISGIITGATELFHRR